MARTKDERYRDGDCLGCGDPLDDVSLSEGFERCGECSEQIAREVTSAADAHLAALVESDPSYRPDVPAGAWIAAGAWLADEPEPWETYGTA